MRRTSWPLALAAAGGILLATPLLPAANETIPPAAEAKRDSRAVLQAPTIPENLTGTLRTINERLSRDLRPEDNAVVPLLEVMGGDALEPELRPQSLALLGIAALPTGGPQFIPVRDFVRRQETLTAEQRELEAVGIESDLFTALERVWKRSDSTRLFDYLEANGAVLDRLVEASQKPRYYAPVLSRETPPRLLGMEAGIERRLPFLIRLLTARALNRFAEGNFEGARADWLAGRRLAVLLAVGSPFDISVAKAQVLDSVVWFGLTAVLRSGDLTAEQSQKLLADLESVPPLPGAALTADVGERSIVHQELEFLQADPAAIRDFFVPAPADEAATEEPSKKEAAAKEAAEPDAPKADGEKRAAAVELRVPKIDWTLARKEADAIYDRIRDAIAERDRGAQLKRFDELDAEYAAWDASADETGRRLAEPAEDEAAAGRQSEAASRWIGRTMAMSLRPWYRQRRLADNLHTARRDLARIGVALARHYAEHRTYPADLGDLAPAILKEIPSDPLSGKPFTYERTRDSGARVITWGQNGENDALKFPNDDIILELP